MTEIVKDSINTVKLLTENSISILQAGTTDPVNWSEYTLDGLDYNDGADQNLDYPVVARFITPPYFAHDDEDNRLISIVAPPYLGVKEDGTMNRLEKIEFSLNNGPMTTVTESESETRGYECYTVMHPYDENNPPENKTNEVRAIIYYQRGLPRILQGIATELPPSEGDKGPRTVSSWYANDRSFETRGCFIGMYEDYYVDPSGNNNNDGRSPENAMESPFDAYQKAYGNGHTNIRINNSYVKVINIDTEDPQNTKYVGALSIEEYYKPSRRLTDGGEVPVNQASSDFIHRVTLPSIVRGGDIYVNNAGENTSYDQGALFKNCNMCLNPTVDTGNQSGRTMKIRNKNSASNSSFPYRDWCYVTFDGCTIGPEEKPDSHGGGFGEIEDQSYHSKVGGYGLQLVEAGSVYTGNNSIYRCTVNYGCPNAGHEIVDTTIITPPTQNDVSNYGMLVGVNSYDVHPMFYPWGSMGSPKDLPSGSTAKTVKFGIPFSTDGEYDDLHDNISYSDTRYKSYKSIAYREPYNNCPDTFGFDRDEDGNPLEELALPHDKGFWPDYMYVGKKGIKDTYIRQRYANGECCKLIYGSSDSEEGFESPCCEWYGSKWVDQIVAGSDGDCCAYPASNPINEECLSCEPAGCDRDGKRCGCYAGCDSDNPTNCCENITGAWLSQICINMSQIKNSDDTLYYNTTDPNSEWYNKKFKEKPRDPHFDIQQFNAPYNNVVVYNLDVTTVKAGFQGIFWSDEAKVRSSAMWNVVINNRGNLESHPYSVGSVDENNGDSNDPSGTFQHYGPNIKGYMGLDGDGDAIIFNPRNYMTNGEGNSNRDNWFYMNGLDGNWGALTDWDDVLENGTKSVMRSDVPGTNDPSEGIHYTQVSSNTTHT